MIPPRRFSARTVVGALVAAGVVGAGAAVAVQHVGSSPGATISLVPAATSASPSPGARPHGGHRFGGGFAGAGTMGVGRLIGVFTKDTGLTPMQILADVEKGQTLAQIAGSNTAKVRTDALAVVKSDLDGAVTKGVITADQEATLLKDAGDAIDVLMNANLSKAGFGGLGFGGGFRHHGDGAGKTSPAPSPSA